MGTQWNFYRIWITIEKLFMKWAPGHLLVIRVHSWICKCGLKGIWLGNSCVAKFILTNMADKNIYLHVSSRVMVNTMPADDLAIHGDKLLAAITHYRIHLVIQEYDRFSTSLRPGLLRNFHVKIHVGLRRFSNMTPDWLAAQPPANQKPC